MADERATSDLSHDAIALTRELAEAQGIETTMRFFGPDSVYDLHAFGLPIFRGYEAIRGFIEDWYSSYQQADDELLEIAELAGGVVFVAIRETARPSGSPEHAQVSQSYGLVVEWRDGTASRVTGFPDIEAARTHAERLAEERG
jgi:hypothetical protein